MGKHSLRMGKHSLRMGKYSLRMGKHSLRMGKHSLRRIHPMWVTRNALRWAVRQYLLTM